MTNKERMNLLSKKYWDYKEISEYCGISISVATRLKKQVIEKFPNAKNKYNSRWVNNENIIMEFYQENKDKHIQNLMTNIKLMNEMGGGESAGQIG